jgi:predicted RNA-binding Zn-ribbon protein involved in translation (DUF1610 family)
MFLQLTLEASLAHTSSKGNTSSKRSERLQRETNTCSWVQANSKWHVVSIAVIARCFATAKRTKIKRTTTTRRCPNCSRNINRCGGTDAPTWRSIEAEFLDATVVNKLLYPLIVVCSSPLLDAERNVIYMSRRVFGWVVR